MSAKRSVGLIYTRQSVSRFDRDGHAQGPSLDQQLDAVKARPEFKGLTIEHFEDADRSGKETSKRPGYQALMERIRTAGPGDIAAVGFYDQSRLHRNFAAFEQFMVEMERRGIVVYQASGLIRNEDDLSWGVTALVNQHNRKEIARRVKDNLAYLRKQGRLLGTLPIGYRRTGDGGIVVDEQVVPTIRRIFEMYATSSYSFKALAMTLNAEGVKPVTERGGNGLAPAPLWSGDVIKEILERPTYAGLLPVSRHSEDREPVAGTHPAIVSLDLWKRCHEQRTRNRPGVGASVRYHTSPYPLTPILRCGHCGSSMHGTRTGDRGKPHYYYACSGRHRYGTCTAPLVPAATLEAELLAGLAKCQPGELMEATARELLKRGLRAQGTAPSELSDRRVLKNLERRLERTRNLYEWGEIGEAEFWRNKAAIEADVARIKATPALPDRPAIGAPPDGSGGRLAGCHGDGTDQDRVEHPGGHRG